MSLLQVHRKTLNPVFNETFQFGVPLNELHSRKLHFSVYDFDRFSRHDLIGQVVVDNLLDFSEGSGDKPIWRDIVEGTAVGDEFTLRRHQGVTEQKVDDPLAWSPQAARRSAEGTSARQGGRGAIASA